MNNDENNNIDVISEVDSIFMDDEWYDIANTSHFWFKWRLNAMLNQIQDIEIATDKNFNVLEVGCGTCILRDSLEKETCWIIDAADMNIKALSRAQPSRGKTLFYNIFDENENYVSFYDVVLLIDVLEHIEEPNLFLKSLLKHIKPGGYLIINVPALNSLYSKYDKKVGHFRRYNKSSLLKEFNISDVKILDLRYWGFTLIPILFIRFVLMKFINQSNKNIINNGFKPPKKFINDIFSKISDIEVKYIHKPILGTSLLLTAKKI